MKNQALYKPLTAKDKKAIKQKLINVYFNSTILTIIIIFIFIYVGYNEPLVVQVISLLFAIIFLGVLLPLIAPGTSNIKKDLKKGKKKVIFGTIDKKFIQHTYTERFPKSKGRKQYFISIANEGFRVTDKQYLHCAKEDFVALEYAPVSRTVLAIHVTDKNNTERYESKEISAQQFSDTVEDETIATKFINAEELKYLKYKRSNSLSRGLPMAILLGVILFFAFKFALSTFAFTRELFEATNKGEVLVGCFIFLFVVRKAFRPFIPLSRDIKLNLKNIIRTGNVQKISSDTKILQHNWQKIRRSNNYYYLKIGRAYVEITRSQYDSVTNDSIFEIHLTPNYRAILAIEWDGFRISPI